MSDISRWQEQFNSLPPWAQKMVRGLAGCASFGGMDDEFVKAGMSNADRYEGFHVLLSKERKADWWDGFFEMKDLAAAMTAPWPPPPAPDRESHRALNIVELVGFGDDSAFDQPCAFGHRVDDHAVYCHNEAWPDGPRKCRRNRDDYRHEDCPGFVANPDYHPPVSERRE